jgi:hypothetical protein
MPRSADQLAELAVSLFDRVDLGSSQLFRLAGVGLSNFQIEAELPLLASSFATEPSAEEFTSNGRIAAMELDDILLG